MEIGCGARVRDFDGRRYFYFWDYERNNGRSERKDDYLGRVDSNRAKPVYPNKSKGTKRRDAETIAMPKARNRTKNCFMTDESSDGGSIANRIHDSPDRCFLERRP